MIVILYQLTENLFSLYLRHLKSIMKDIIVIQSIHDEYHDDGRLIVWKILKIKIRGKALTSMQKSPL